MKTNYSLFNRTWLCAGLTFACTAMLSVNSQAQTAPAKQWDKTFGGYSNDRFTCFQPTADGGYIMGGTSGSGVSGDKSQPLVGWIDYWVVKTDAAGNKVWDKTFGGSDVDQLNAIQQTPDGGYILGGWSYSGIGGDKTQALQTLQYADMWLVRLDANGNKLWDKSFGGDKNDYLYTLQVTSDGGYIFGGLSNSGMSGDKTQPSMGGDDFWVVRLDAGGNKLWDKTIGGGSSDVLNSLHQNMDGSYILGGWSTSGMGGDKASNSKGGRDFWIVKLNANGNKMWDKTFGGSGHDELEIIQQTSDGGYILGGASLSGIGGDKTQASNGDQDYWIVKIDAYGNKTWDKSFGGSNTDWCTSLQQTSDGGYILGGYSNSGTDGNKTGVNKGDSDYWIVRTDAAGNKLWDQTFGGSGEDELYAVKQNANGEYFLGGASTSPDNGDKSQFSQGTHDYWIIKLGSNITGIKELQPTFNFSISPNPNQGRFRLQLSNLKTPTTQVTITDMLGRRVLQQQLPVTDQQFSEELTLPASKGIYIVQVKAGDEMLTRKIVVE